MSITAVNLTDGIRVDLATQKGSIYDVISVVTKATSVYAVRILSRIQKQYPENMTKCHKLRINGKGRETPVADAATLVEIAWLCPGKAAVGELHLSTFLYIFLGLLKLLIHCQGTGNKTLLFVFGGVC